MPLIQSSSKEAFNKNIAAEIKAGKPPKQAAAIAYSVQRENRDNDEQRRKDVLAVSKLQNLALKIGATRTDINRYERALEELKKKYPDFSMMEFIPEKFRTKKNDTDARLAKSILFSYPHKIDVPEFRDFRKSGLFKIGLGYYILNKYSPMGGLTHDSLLNTLYEKLKVKPNECEGIVISMDDMGNPRRDGIINNLRKFKNLQGILLNVAKESFRDKNTVENNIIEVEEKDTMKNSITDRSEIGKVYINKTSLTTNDLIKAFKSVVKGEKIYNTVSMGSVNNPQLLVKTYSGNKYALITYGGEVRVLKDSSVKDEKVSGPRGTFTVSEKTRKELEAEGYGYHHTFEKNGKQYHVMTKNNIGVACTDSIMQEYGDFLKQLRPETKAKLEKYLKLHKELTLADVVYNKFEWDKFENWAQGVKDAASFNLDKYTNDPETTITQIGNSQVVELSESDERNTALISALKKNGFTQKSSFKFVKDSAFDKGEAYYYAHAGDYVKINGKEYQINLDYGKIGYGDIIGLTEVKTGKRTKISKKDFIANAQLTRYGKLGDAKKVSDTSKRDIESIMKNEVAKSFAIKSVSGSGANWKVTTSSGKTVNVKFDTNWDEWVYEINGKGPYSHNSYEYIVSDIEKYVYNYMKDSCVKDLDKVGLIKMAKSFGGVPSKKYSSGYVGIEIRNPEKADAFAIWLEENNYHYVTNNFEFFVELEDKAVCPKRDEDPYENIIAENNNVGNVGTTLADKELTEYRGKPEREFTKTLSSDWIEGKTLFGAVGSTRTFKNKNTGEELFLTVMNKSDKIVSVLVKDSKETLKDSVESDFSDITNMSDAKELLKKYGINLVKKDNRNYVLQKDGKSYTFYVLDNPNEVRADLVKAVKKLTMKDTAITDADKYTFKLTKKKNEYDEYVIKAYKNGKYYEDATYYTDDWEDAVATLKDLAKRQGQTVKQQGNVLIADKNISDAPYIPNQYLSELKRYAQRFGYKWEEILDGFNSRTRREGMSVEEAIKDLEETMVANKSLYDSEIVDILNNNELVEYANEISRVKNEEELEKIISKIATSDKELSKQLFEALKKDYYNFDRKKQAISNAIILKIKKYNDNNIEDAKMTVDRMVQIITPIVREFAKKKGVDDYWKIHKNGKNVSVGIELGYKSLDELCDILNKKLAPLTDSYFEPADAGLIETTIFDKNTVTDASIKNLKASNVAELKSILNNWKRDESIKVELQLGGHTYTSIYYYKSVNGYYSIPTSITNTTTEYDFERAKQTALNYASNMFKTVKDASVFSEETMGKVQEGIEQTVADTKKKYAVSIGDKKFTVEAKSERDAALQVVNSLSEQEDERLSPMSYKKLRELGYNENDWKGKSQEWANKTIAAKSKSSETTSNEKPAEKKTASEEVPENIERIAKRIISNSGYTPTNEGLLNDLGKLETQEDFEKLLKSKPYYRYNPETLGLDAKTLKAHIEKLKASFEKPEEKTVEENSNETSNKNPELKEVTAKLYSDLEKELSKEEREEFRANETPDYLSEGFPIYIENDKDRMKLAKALAKLGITEAMYYWTPGGPIVEIKGSPKALAKFNKISHGDVEEFEEHLKERIKNLTK